MRIPSTSDLCQAHSNRAYDKMEVISDHIHELMDLYEWIFNLRAYLASLLAGYVTIGTDQTITGKKTFENYPFTMQQGLYLTSDDTQHQITDTVAEILKQGTLSIGYVAAESASLANMDRLSEWSVSRNILRQLLSKQVFSQGQSRAPPLLWKECVHGVQRDLPVDSGFLPCRPAPLPEDKAS